MTEEETISIEFLRGICSGLDKHYDEVKLSPREEGKVAEIKISNPSFSNRDILTGLFENSDTYNIKAPHKNEIVITCHFENIETQTKD